MAVKGDEHHTCKKRHIWRQSSSRTEQGYAACGLPKRHLEQLQLHIVVLLNVEAQRIDDCQRYEHSSCAMHICIARADMDEEDAAHPNPQSAMVWRTHLDALTVHSSPLVQARVRLWPPVPEQPLPTQK